MTRLLLMTCALAALATTAIAMPYHADPDWPCAQLLVPELAPGSYWDTPVPLHTAWRDDDKLFPLVTDIVNRDTPDAEALAKLGAYADTIAKPDRAKTYPLIFSAIVDQTNDERTLLINRIKQLGLRQRRMGDVIADISTKADQMPASDPQHADIVGERDFDVKAFQDMQHTMRYACEAPANMDRRLGLFAKLLRDKEK